MFLFTRIVAKIIVKISGFVSNRTKMTDDKMDMLIDNACKVAEEFTKLFYEAMDKKRHTLNRFYMDSATIAWDGHSETGKDAIQKMLEGLPMTVHTLSTLDAQPVSIEAVKGQQTVLVQASGNVRIAKEPVMGFSESFVITAQDNKWKIFSDCCRLQRPITTGN